MLKTERSKLKVQYVLRFLRLDLKNGTVTIELCLHVTGCVGEKAQNWTGLAGPTFLDVSINDPAKNGQGSLAQFLASKQHLIKGDSHDIKTERV